MQREIIHRVYLPSHTQLAKSWERKPWLTALRLVDGSAPAGGGGSCRRWRQGRTPGATRRLRGSTVACRLLEAAPTTSPTRCPRRRRARSTGCSRRLGRHGASGLAVRGVGRLCELGVPRQDVVGPAPAPRVGGPRRAAPRPPPTGQRHPCNPSVTPASPPPMAPSASPASPSRAGGPSRAAARAR